MSDDACTEPEAQPNARHHDDVQPCIETVIASLSLRSKKDREALLLAVMDGDALPSETHPVSGTITSPEQTWKTAEICGKLPFGGPVKSHYDPPWPTQKGPRIMGPRTLQEAWPHAYGCADSGAETGGASL